MLQQFLPGEIFAYLLVFTRMGATFMLLPGFGETYVSPQIRLAMAIVITVLLTPIVAGILPATPASPVAMALLILGEVFIGAFIGLIARFLFAALSTAGTMLAFQVGLSNALLFNPLLSDQGALPAVFLSIFGLLMVFVTDSHHLMLLALLDGYTLFPPGTAPIFSDFAGVLSRLLADSFSLGLQIAMPFVVFGIVFFTGLGLLARLMPQMPIFFVGLPAQISLGLFMMMVTFPAALLWFLNYYQVTFSRLLLPG